MGLPERRHGRLDRSEPVVHLHDARHLRGQADRDEPGGRRRRDQDRLHHGRPGDPPPPAARGQTFNADRRRARQVVQRVEQLRDADHLRLRNGGTSSDSYRSYLKFDVSGLSGAATSAKLRMFVTDASPDGGSVFKVDNAWTETGLTWANAPALGGSSLGGAGATATNGTWAEIRRDLGGDRQRRGELRGRHDQLEQPYYTSREGATNKPQLVDGRWRHAAATATRPSADGGLQRNARRAAPRRWTSASPTPRRARRRAWEWDFQNDGTMDITTRNPSFTYTRRELRRQADRDQRQR